LQMPVVPAGQWLSGSFGNSPPNIGVTEISEAASPQKLLGCQVKTNQFAGKKLIPMYSCKR
jgi:hypothetical protein